jgi:hypothetical protein
MRIFGLQLESTGQEYLVGAGVERAGIFGWSCCQMG